MLRERAQRLAGVVGLSHLTSKGKTSEMMSHTTGPNPTCQDGNGDGDEGEGEDEDEDGDGDGDVDDDGDEDEDEDEDAGVTKHKRGGVSSSMLGFSFKRKGRKERSKRQAGRLADSNPGWPAHHFLTPVSSQSTRNAKMSLPSFRYGTSREGRGTRTQSPHGSIEGVEHASEEK